MQWNLLKVQMFLFVDLLGPYVLFIWGVKFQTPSIWDIETNSPSIEGFDISMATSFVHPFEDMGWYFHIV